MNPTTLLAIAAGALATLPIHIVIALWNRARWNGIYAEMTALALSKVEEAFRRGHDAAWPAMQELLDVTKQREEAKAHANRLFLALEILFQGGIEKGIAPTAEHAWPMKESMKRYHAWAHRKEKVVPGSLSVDDKKPVEL